MGGNALSCGSIRIDKGIYEDVCETLMADCEGSLTEYYNSVRIIPSYSDKADFGDIDVICFKALNISEDNLKSLLKEYYGATEFVRNGNVLSFDMRCWGLGDTTELPGIGPAIQVDLLEFTKRETFNFAYLYFSYNDLGNLIGRIAHNMGFKFGHDGLTFKYLDGTCLIREITLTTSFFKALEFLGYSASKYLYGFKTLEDIFEYVASSEFFHPDIFLLENRDGESRRRDAKRKTYSAFLKWCEENRDRLTQYKFSKDREKYLIKGFKAFPEFEDQYGECVREAFVRTHLKQAFNGNLVRDVTKLEGVALGEFMNQVKASFGSKVLFEEKLLNSPDEVWARTYSLFTEAIKA